MFSNKTIKGLTERQHRIYKFLRANPVGVLSTVSPNSEPHGVVIYFAIDKEFNVSFLTKTGTRKYDNLMKNTHAMLVVFDQDSQTVAQVIGEAVEITDNFIANEVATEVLKISQNTSQSGTPPISKLEAGGYTCFRIVPKQIRIASYDKSDPSDYRRIFESIESFVLKDDEN